MSTVSRLISADDLFRMPTDEAQACELINGEILRMSPPGFAHGIVTQNVSWMLTNHVRRHRLGIVTAAETGFVVSRGPDTVLAPDGGFVRQERVNAIGIPVAYFPEAPTLIFEVLSPHDRRTEVTEKLHRWFQSGIEMAWIVDPETRTVTVYKSVDDSRRLTEHETLSGEQVLPGFQCSVADCFAGT